jgi:hypothetical protein
MYNNSQSMVPFSYSDHQLLWAHQHLPIAVIFWTLQLRTQMLYLSHYDIMTHSHFKYNRIHEVYQTQYWVKRAGKGLKNGLGNGKAMLKQKRRPGHTQMVHW